MQKDGIFFEMLESEITCQKKDIGFGIDDRPPHNHDGYEVLFMLEGVAIMESEGRKRELNRGDLALIRSGTAHHGEPRNRHLFDRVIINVQEATARKLIKERPQVGRSLDTSLGESMWICHLDTGATDEFMHYSDDLERLLKEEDFGCDVLARSYLLSMLVLLERIGWESVDHNDASACAKKELVQKLQVYIEQHIADDLSLGILEKCFCYSGSYLSKCFKSVTGLSLQNYIIKKRVSLARKYIAKGDHLMEVCNATGFGNYSNFCRTFALYTGESPMDYRKKCSNFF